MTDSFYNACENGDMKTVIAELQKTDQQDNIIKQYDLMTALYIAIQSNQYSIVQLLIGRGVCIDKAVCEYAMNEKQHQIATLLLQTLLNRLIQEQDRLKTILLQRQMQTSNVHVEMRCIDKSIYRK